MAHAQQRLRFVYCAGRCPVTAALRVACLGDQLHTEVVTSLDGVTRPGVVHTSIPKSGTLDGQHKSTQIKVTSERQSFDEITGSENNHLI
jgi:hypothetical protein